MRKRTAFAPSGKKRQVRMRYVCGTQARHWQGGGFPEDTASYPVAYLAGGLCGCLLNIFYRARVVKRKGGHKLDSRQEDATQLKAAFLKSRAAAILRCAEVIAGSGRKDVAKNVLVATHIDRQRLEDLKTQSIKGENHG